MIKPVSNGSDGASSTGGIIGMGSIAKMEVGFKGLMIGIKTVGLTIGLRSGKAGIFGDKPGNLLGTLGVFGKLSFVGFNGFLFNGFLFNGFLFGDLFFVGV